MILENPQIAYALVNYTTLPTHAANEVYVAETNMPESTAFCIRNNFIVELSILRTQDVLEEK